jgi:hypothetical protein
MFNIYDRKKMLAAWESKREGRVSSGIGYCHLLVVGSNSIANMHIK